MKWVGGDTLRLGRRWAVPTITTVGIGLAALVPPSVWAAVVQR